MHHRRQRCREFRRRALPQVRADGAQRAAVARRSRSRAKCSRSAATRSIQRGLRPAGADDRLRRHARRRSRKITVKLLPQAAECARVHRWRHSTTSRMQARPVGRDHRRRHRSGWPGNDGQARPSRGRAVRRTPATRWMPRRSCCAKSDGTQRRSRGRDRAHAKRAAGGRRDRASACRSDEPNACDSGPAARPHSPRWAASRPITTAWTAPFRANAFADVLDSASRSCPREFELRVRERVSCRRRQPASADPVRRQQCRPSSSGPKRSARTSSSSASKSAARSPASMASASRRSTQMCVAVQHRRTRCFHGIKRAFDPLGLLNPGKAVPTLHRCAELGAMHVQGGQLPHPELPRF